jgi:hypothetical protein
MSDLKTNQIQSPMIDGVVEQIARLTAPERIYLYNQRINSRHEVTSFKLCMVVDVPDKFAAERDIYMDIDCDVPFDILIYTREEWEGLTANHTSFAYKVKETGTVVYNGKA